MRSLRYRSELVFDNPGIAPEDLPTTEHLDWQPLDPRYVSRLQVPVVLIGAGLLLGILFLGWLPLPIADAIPVIPAIIVLIAVVAAFVLWPAISVPRKRYAIRNRDIVYRAGVIRHSVTAIPLNRVQHVETSSTPLDRRFRLATLKLYTAGGAGGDLRICGLPESVAERMRMFVLERLGEEAEDD